MSLPALGPGSRSPVLVVGGYGVRLSVHRGRLVIEHGLARDRFQLVLSRIERAVRRIVILADTGAVSLEAVRWCADLGIAVVQLDRDGRQLFTSVPPGADDARLRRAQAAAPNSATGLRIAQALLAAKLRGQTAVASGSLQAREAGQRIAELARLLEACPDLQACRDLEAQAANIYFAAWAGRVQPRFADRARNRVPDHWQAPYAVRSSPLHRGGRSPRGASDPVNALLNYGYALAEVEARLAAIAVGLDPGLGIVHTDHKNRDSLALDLLEPLRPLVDRHVLDLLAARHFTMDDFHESRDGVCRVLSPLTGHLCGQMVDYARTVAPLAEQAAHLLAASSPGQVALRTPLSRANTAAAQVRGKRSANRRAAAPSVKERPTCQRCGVELYGSARKLCPSCWPVTRRVYMAELGRARAKPDKPAKPTLEQLAGGWTLKEYQTRILPALAGIPLPEMERATGLSNAACSRIRRGLQIPNPRHWCALAELAGARATVGAPSETPASPRCD